MKLDPLRMEQGASSNPKVDNAVGPLKGIRVVDVSWVAAGPACTMMLAQLGAEVIRIESRNALDMYRRRMLNLRPDERKTSNFDPLNLSWTFTAVNLNKKSVTLDLKSKLARGALEKIVENSDVFVSNLRPGVLERLGLGHEVLARLNERLVIVEISSAGATGPDSNSSGYASSFSAAGGLASITGYEGGEPCVIGRQLDMRVAMSATLATIAGLIQSRKTGRGLHVDLVAREVVSHLIGEFALARSASIESNSFVKPQGNTRFGAAPRGSYLCQDGRWIAISACEDVEWRRLNDVLGLQQSKGFDFEGKYERWIHRAAIDLMIGEKTRLWGAYQLSVRLQRDGVAAELVSDGRQILSDRHVIERGFLRSVDQPGLGELPVVGQPWSFNNSEVPPVEPAPALGADTHDVLAKAAGLSESAISKLDESGALI